MSLRAGEYYDIEIMDTVLMVSGKKGTPGIEFLLKVSEGEEAHTMKHVSWLSDSVIRTGDNAGKSGTEVNLTHLNDQFGLPETLDTEALRAHFKGIKGRAKLDTETYNGKTRLMVKNIYSSKLQTTTIDPQVLAKLNNFRLSAFKPAASVSAAKSKTTKKFFATKEDA